MTNNTQENPYLEVDKTFLAFNHMFPETKDTATSRSIKDSDREKGLEDEPEKKTRNLRIKFLLRRWFKKIYQRIPDQENHRLGF